MASADSELPLDNVFDPSIREETDSGQPEDPTGLVRDSTNEWATSSDAGERRRISNRLALRNYRKMVKKRREDLERTAEVYDESTDPGNLGLENDVAPDSPPSVSVLSMPKEEESRTGESFGEGFTFITGSKASDFKKKSVMAIVRKKAMGSYLNDYKPRRTSTPLRSEEMGDELSGTIISNDEALKIFRAESRRPRHGLSSELQEVHTPPESQTSFPSTKSRTLAHELNQQPSCDACREGKVLCDALDVTSTCSRCTRLKKKCQFTKEPNRRIAPSSQLPETVPKEKSKFGGVVQTARAIFDYRPQNRDTEMAFNMENQIEVIIKESNGWWYGRNLESGQEGWFPSSYVAEHTGTGVDGIIDRYMSGQGGVSLRDAFIVAQGVETKTAVAFLEYVDDQLKKLDTRIAAHAGDYQLSRDEFDLLRLVPARYAESEPVQRAIKMYYGTLQDKPEPHVLSEKAPVVHPREFLSAEAAIGSLRRQPDPSSYNPRTKSFIASTPPFNYEEDRVQGKDIVSLSEVHHTHVPLNETSSQASSYADSIHSTIPDESDTHDRTNLESPFTSDISDFESEDSDMETEMATPKVGPVKEPEQEVENPEFLLEDIEDDGDYMEIVRPYQVEDALDHVHDEDEEEESLIERFKDLQCEVDSSDEEEQQRRYMRKKQRWSAGTYKRSHSQCSESGESNDETDDPLDSGQGSRRLRRRVGGLEESDQSVLHHNHKPWKRSPSIISSSDGSLSISSDDAFGINELWPEGDHHDMSLEREPPTELTEHNISKIHNNIKSTLTDGPRHNTATMTPEEDIHGKAVVLFDFISENENEMALKEGQIIMISYRHGEGWLVAQDPKTGQSGLVPEVYVRLLRDVEGGMSGLSRSDPDAAANLKRTMDSPPATPTSVQDLSNQALERGRGGVESQRRSSEERRDWASRSYRSTSVTTSIGSDTDATDISEALQDMKGARKARKLWRKPDGHYSADLPALEEESDDESMRNASDGKSWFSATWGSNATRTVVDNLLTAKTPVEKLSGGFSSQDITLASPLKRWQIFAQRALWQYRAGFIALPRHQLPNQTRIEWQELAQKALREDQRRRTNSSWNRLLDSTQESSDDAPTKAVSAENTDETFNEDNLSPHLHVDHTILDGESWKEVRDQLPEEWMWDVDYHTTHNASGDDRGCWTCTPTDGEPKEFPLTIASAPVVIPVDYRWPPIAGVNPPPDPRPSQPIDCTAELSLEVIRDVLLTFEGSIGFYFLVNGMLQIIVSEDFDTAWASSHLPHKYGGLRVSYITQSLEPTMFPSKTDTMKTGSSQSTSHSQGSSMSSLFSQLRSSTSSVPQPLQINSFIEARTKVSHRKEKYAGRIGLQVTKKDDSFLVMPTHVITEAILAKSSRTSLFGRKREPYEQLECDWNEQVEIWAGNDRIGTIEKSFDVEAELYPDGFKHDVTIIKPTHPASAHDVRSPVQDIGWLSREGWNSLRQQNSPIKFLGETENHRRAKTLKCNRPSEILTVGEGIFLNQAAAKLTRDHDTSVWRDLVSRCVLYRVYPDFDPPNGYSGIALYADGLREDGTTGPGVVGFQSFVQRSGHVQNFEMEGSALEKRLRLGRVAFYGAFEVPDEMRSGYGIV